MKPAPGLAIITALVQTIGTAIIARDSVGAFGFVLLGAAGLTLVARRCYPVGTLVTVAGLTVAYHLMGYPAGITFLAPVVAVMTAVAAKRRGAVTVTGAVCYFLWLLNHRPSLGEAISVIALFIVASLLIEFLVVFGRIVRQFARQQTKLTEERKRRQSSEERLRIARELHDVLGHHLSLINVRAGVGLHLMDRRPEQARAALDTIKSASAEALREVRSVLDALYPAGEAAPRRPAPGLDRLTDLTHDAGLPVETRITGEPRPLPAEIDRAAYRMVQEALTNVRRHAGAGAAARVSIVYSEELLVVEVSDDGGAAVPISEQPLPGNGLSGMRERAAALGGSLAAGALPDGGWRVRAELPLTKQAP